MFAITQHEYGMNQVDYDQNDEGSEPISEINAVNTRRGDQSKKVAFDDDAAANTSRRSRPANDLNRFTSATNRASGVIDRLEELRVKTREDTAAALAKHGQKFEEKFGLELQKLDKKWGDQYERGMKTISDIRDTVEGAKAHASNSVAQLEKKIQDEAAHNARTVHTLIRNLAKNTRAFPAESSG